MSFDSLPNEVVIHILQQLSAEDLVRIGGACQRLHDLTQVDSLWEHRCQADYNFTSTEGWGDGVTFFDIYSKVLHLYGSCLGLWHYSKESTYGILLKVQSERGKFTAQRLKYPETFDVSVPLTWSDPVFTVTLRDGQGQLTCHKGCSSPNVCLKRDGDILKYECSKCVEKMKDYSDQAIFKEMMTLEGPAEGEPLPRSVSKNYIAFKLTGGWSKFSMPKVVPPVQSPVSPITLGLYKGCYGSHGIEVIRLSLADNGYQILGDKLLGDPNVPAGEMSLCIDLRRPMTLTAEQQDFEVVKSLDPDTLPSPFGFPGDARQPFSLSPNIYIEDSNQLPSTCRARYAGLGQIAAHGFQNPRKCRGHMVVFSPQLFGFFFLDITSFNVLRLTDEDFN